MYDSSGLPTQHAGIFYLLEDKINVESWATQKSGELVSKSLTHLQNWHRLGDVWLRECEPIHMCDSVVQLSLLFSLHLLL